MRTVLVTGAGGFIGSSVLKLLDKNPDKIHAVSRTVPLPDHPYAVSNITWHKTDLFNAEQTVNLLNLVQPTHLLHLAWEAEPGLYWTSPANFQWAEASLRLIRYFHANGGQRFVAAGTCAEYDWKHGVLSEASPLAFTSPYATCKNITRLLMQAYSEQAGLSFAWGRLFYLYGPRESPSRFVPTVIRSLLRQTEATCTNGNDFRDYLYVDDAASALITLLETDAGGTFNIASGQAISLKTLTKTIAAMLGTPELVRCEALRAEQNETPLVLGDVRRLRDLGWSPETGLEAGLECTIAWWKETMKGEER